MCCWLFLLVIQVLHLMISKTISTFWNDMPAKLVRFICSDSYVSFNVILHETTLHEIISFPGKRCRYKWRFDHIEGVKCWGKTLITDIRWHISKIFVLCWFKTEFVAMKLFHVVLDTILIENHYSKYVWAFKIAHRIV